MNTATITIEVDDAGATQAFRRVNAEAGKLGPTLQPIQRISEQTFNNIEGGALRAREAAALMGEEFGVHVPRALRGVLAESTAIGPALSAAFSGLALIGFIDIAKNAGEAVAKFVDKLAGWSEFAKSTMDAQSALNKEIVDSIDNIKKLDKAYRLIGLEGVAKFAEQQKISNEELDAAKKKVADLTAEMKKLAAASLETRVVQRVAITGSSAIGIPSAEPTDAARKAMEQFGAVSIALASAQKTLKEFGAETRNVDKELSSAFRKEQADAIRKIATATEEASVRLREITSAANRGGFTGEAQIQADALAQINAVEKIYSKEPTLAADAAAAVAAIHAEASRKRIKLLTDEADKAIRIGDEEDAAEARDKQRQLEKERRMEDETLNIERSSAVASALPWDRANVSIISSYQERMDKIREMLNTHDLDEAHAAREQAAAWNEAFGQMRDNLASQMQGLFDDITSGNIGKTFKKMFEQIVFQMVATWILGMRGMRAASAGAMGGGAGGILGALFGLGGGGGTNGSLISAAGGLAALPLLSGGSSTDLATSIPLLGLGLSAGQGAGLPGLRLPSGAASGGAAGALGGFGGALGSLLTSRAFTGLALTGGAGLLLSSIGMGGGAKGALTGAAGGALIGTVIPGIGTLLGAGIGALVGLIAGLFGQHKGDKARIGIMEPLIAQIKIVRDSYDVFQTDYNTGISELEKLRSDALAGLRQIGGRQVSGNTRSTNKLVDDAESYLKTTQAERARRGQIAFGAPQFHEGGFVHPSLASAMPSYFRSNALALATGGEVPAILHSGEFVMNQSAVRRVGRDSLDRMNAGGGGGDVHHHWNVTAMDAKSFESWLKDGAGVSVLKFLRYADNVGMA